jgi:hypothetical protein
MRGRYVRARSLTGVADLQRAGVPDADRVIIFAGSDTDTLAAASPFRPQPARAHRVLFRRRGDCAPAHLALRQVEVVMAPAVELVVRAVKIRGSSQLLSDLVSHTDAGMTLFSMPWGGAADHHLPPLADRLIAWARCWSATAAGAPRAQAPFRFAEGDVGPGDRFSTSRQRLRPKPGSGGMSHGAPAVGLPMVEG